MNRQGRQVRSMSRGFGPRALSLAALLSLAAAPEAIAERIENTVAVFAALDKVTARISKLEVPLNQTVRFGSLKVTPRSCFSRPATEPPKTTTFVEVDEVLLDGQEKRLFTGWMFAESPGLNAVEHPVFDVWLTQCSQPSRNVTAVKGPKGDVLEMEPQPQEPTDLPRRRVRR
jgi:hypothetical protein